MSINAETAPMRTELIVPGLGPSMNATTLREHWSKKTKRRNQWQKLFAYSTRNRHQGRVRLEIHRYSLGRSMDQDNLRASYKTMVDALVRAGIIKDDNDQIVVESHYQHVKCMHPSGQKTLIIITDI